MKRSSDPKARYRKVETRIWGDAKFRALSPQRPSGQALFLHLLICRWTTALPGLLGVSAAALADDLKWPLDDFFRCWAEIEARGMAKADWDAPLVWVPNAIRYNAPANPNVVKGWLPHLEEIPECPLKAEACAHLAAALPGTGDFPAAAKVFGPHAGQRNHSRNGSRNGSGNGSWNQEQEQEQEKEEPPPTPSAGGGREGGDSSATPSGENAEEEEADEDPAPPPRDAPQADRPPTEEERRQAEAVVRHYDQTVRPKHRGVARSVEAAVARLMQGETIERLTAAAGAYAADLDSEKPEPKDARWRQTARTFFGESRGKYPQYRDRPPRVSPADRPDLAPKAKELVAYYRRLVDPAYADDGAEQVVLQRLAEGVTAESLWRACRGYAAEVARKNLKPEARKGAPRFFKDDWQRFRDFRAPDEPPPLPPEVQALHNEWRRRGEGRPEADAVAVALLRECEHRASIREPGRTLVALILRALLAEGADEKGLRRAIGNLNAHHHDAGTPPRDCPSWREFLTSGAWHEWDRELVSAADVAMALYRHRRRRGQNPPPLTADELARHRRIFEIATAPDHPDATPQARQAAAEPEARELAEMLLGRPDGAAAAESPPPAA